MPDDQREWPAGEDGDIWDRPVGAETPDGGGDPAALPVPVLEPMPEGEVDALSEGDQPWSGAPVREARRVRGLNPDGTFRSGRLAGKTMWGALWVLSWPVMLESFLNSGVGLTDTLLAAQLPNGTPATDAIGGASYMMWFIGLVIMAVGVGATAMISRAMGAGRMAQANAVLGQSLTVAMGLGALVGVVVAVLAPFIGGVLNLSEDARRLFSTYLFVIAWGTPAASALFVLVACARGAGDNIRPLYAMAARNVVNIVVSWLLCGADIRLPEWLGGTLLANPSPVRLGVAGIAIGTVAGDISGALIVLGMAMSGTWGIRLRARRLRPHKVTVWRLQRLSIPNFAETAGMWAGNFILMVIVGGLGAGLIGSHIIAIRIESFSFLPGFAMGTAAATLAGQYLGAGRPDLAKRAVWRCTVIGTTLMGLMGLAFALFNEELVGLLSKQEAHLENAPFLVFVIGLVQVPFALAIITRQAMRGAGDVRVVMAITWITTYAVRLPLVLVCSRLPAWGEAWGWWDLPDASGVSWGLRGLWIAMCVELLLRGGIFFGRFLHGGWMRQRV